METMEFMEIILILAAICAVGLILYASRKKRQEQISDPVSIPEQPAVPVPEPVNYVVLPMVIYSDKPRNPRVCPDCDGENAQTSTSCRICGCRLP